MPHPGTQESPGLRRQRQRIDGLSVCRPHPVGNVQVTIVYPDIARKYARLHPQLGRVGGVKKEKDTNLTLLLGS